MPVQTSALLNISYDGLRTLIDALSGNEPESRSFDLKARFPNAGKDNQKFADRVAAFANEGGGTILYGVREDKENQTLALDGIDVEEYKKFSEWASLVVAANVDPPPRVTPILVEAGEDGKPDFVLLIIEGGRLRPYQSNGKFPLRNGTTTGFATRSQVIDMIYSTQASEQRLANLLTRQKFSNVSEPDFLRSSLSATVGQVAVPEIAKAQTDTLLAGSPMCGIAVTPAALDEVNLPRLTTSTFNEMRSIVGETCNWSVMPNDSFQIGHRPILTAKGLLFRSQYTPPQTALEVHRNGHVEVFSTSTFYIGAQEHDGAPYILATYLSGVVGYAISLAKFQTSWLQRTASYEGDLILSIGMRGISAAKLHGLGTAQFRFGRYYQSAYDDRLLLTYRISYELLSDEEEAAAFVKTVALDFAAAFGCEHLEEHFPGFPITLARGSSHHGYPFER